MTRGGPLEASCRQVFEDLAYMICDPMDDSSLFSEQDEILEAEISWSGDRSGSLLAAGSKELFELLARMATGEESGGVSSEQALSELINIVCGLYLHAVAPGAMAEIGLPAVRATTSASWGNLAESQNLCIIRVEHMPFVIKVDG